jgi:hypothetical protein
MGEVTTTGLDIAKSVFQIHGVDDAGAVGMRKRMTKAPRSDTAGSHRKAKSHFTPSAMA